MSLHDRREKFCLSFARHLVRQHKLHHWIDQTVKRDAFLNCDNGLSPQARRQGSARVKGRILPCLDNRRVATVGPGLSFHRPICPRQGRDQWQFDFSRRAA